MIVQTVWAERQDREMPGCHSCEFALILKTMFRSLAIKGQDLRRAPYWIALLAMLLQFVASYGHLHPQDFNFLLHGHGHDDGLVL